MTRLVVDIRGEDKATAEVELVGRRLADMRTAWRTIALPHILRGEAKVFATRGTSIGEHWPPLKGSTVRIKRGRGQGSRPMVATGKLHRALSGPAGGARLAFGTKEMTFGLPSRIYDIPATKRPVLGIDRATRKAISRDLGEYLTGE